MKNPEISIIVHTYDRAEFLKVMIQSVRDTTPPEAYEILVVSSDPPETEKVKWLKQQDDVFFIQGDIRRPWELRKQSAFYYINLGIKKSAKPWVVVVNDDMSFDKDWYIEFSKLVSEPSNSNVGMIIAAMHLGKVKHGRRIVKMGRTKKSGQDWKNLYLADLAFLRREAIERIGYYDEKIDWAGGGADLPLAMEFLSNTETITSDKIKIDHFIVKENRNTTFTHGFTGFHYVLNKWNKWCAANDCQYFWDVKIKPFTLKNRIIDYLYNKARVVRHYIRYFTGYYR